MPRALDYSHWKSVAVDFDDRGDGIQNAKLRTTGETVVFSFFQNTKRCRLYCMNCLLILYRTRTRLWYAELALRSFGKMNND